MIDYEAALPPYRQLAAILRARIEDGRITRRLPSERDIVGEFGVGLATARKAVALLREAGLIETTPGWGSHVLEQQ